MRKFLRKLFRLTSVTWSNLLMYRGDVVVWTIAETITPLVAFAVWYTVTKHSETPFAPRDMLTYYIFTLAAYIVTNAWVSVFLTDEILKGDLVKYLIRPLSVFWDHALDSIVVKMLRIVPLGLIITAVLWSFPEWFSPSIFNSNRILLAMLSLLAGAIIAFLADAALSMSAFWIEDAHQIIGFHHLLWSFSSGLIIPLALLNPKTHAIVSLLPYRYIISAPIEILLEPARSGSSGSLLLIQAAWIIGLILLLRWLWKKGLKRYAIPGQ